MLFAVDIGNSSIRFGGFDQAGTLCLHARVSTKTDRSEDEYAVLIDSLFRLNRSEPAAVDGAIISSVVPGLTHRLSAAVKTVFGLTALVVGPGIRTGFHIRMDAPSEVGADLVANTAAVLKKYGAPAMILDFGTVTTLTVLDASRTFAGGCILPGVASSLSAMRQTAVQLPEVTLEAPVSAIGKNTADCMRSGLLYGSAAAVDGMIDRLCAELNLLPRQVHLVATGGLAELVIPHLCHPVISEPDLTLYGLCALYLANR